MLMILERECLDFSEVIEPLSEKQELLATLMEGKMRLQQAVLEKFQVKHQVGKIGKGKESSKDVTSDGTVRGRRWLYRVLPFVW